jgi:signal transduction histidine kinase
MTGAPVLRHTADVCLGAGLAFAISAWTPLPPRVDAALLLGLAAIGHAVARGQARRVVRTTANGVADVRRLKQEFLSTVSHELRTPLNAILGWTELLRARDGVSPDERERGLRIIARNARREQRLIEELLDAAVPVDAVLDRRTLDLREMVEELLDDLQPMAQERGVRIDTDLGWPVELADAFLVPGDSLRLRLALTHVVENALRFTPSGGLVQVRLRGAPQTVTIEVCDSGMGIDATFQPHVFEPFRQQDASPSRAHGGLGLGLAIAQVAVEAHGGSIRVRSAGAGRGSTFVVTLPRLGDADAVAEVQRRGARSHGPAT